MSTLIACPHCHRKNRVPDHRLAGEGKCGACHQPLFSGEPMVLNGASFDAHANSELPLVVDFWAPWCGPCRQFAPVFEKAAASLEPAARFGKLNTEEQASLADRFAIRSIPTLVVFKQGREIGRLSGALPLEQFKQWLRQYL